MSDATPDLPPPALPTPPPATSPPLINGITSDDRSMAMLAHLLGVFTGWLGPLIIWLVKKDTSAFAADQAKEALNFQITFLIIAIPMLVGCVIPVLGCLVLPVFLVLAIGRFVFGIIATIKANEGVWYRHPLCIRLIK